MKKYILIIMLFLISTIPGAGICADPWTPAQKYAQAGITAMQIIDWGQTRNIASHPESFRESNPIMGNHPSKGSVDAYFLLSIPVHILATHFTPSKYRKYIQAIQIGSSGYCITENFRIGLGVKF